VRYLSRDYTPWRERDGSELPALRLVLGVVADKSNTALAEVLYHMRGATGSL